jgi:hypothetical protein
LELLIAISSALKPNSFNTSSFCSPRSGGCHHPARRARQRHGLTDQADVSALVVRKVQRDAQILDLCVLEHLAMT